jgi:hypothetical protein
MQIILKIILRIGLFFFLINLAVLLGGLEGWFGWEFGAVVSFALAFGKVFTFLGVSMLVMVVLKTDSDPLLLSGIIFCILIIFGNEYYADFQKAFYQKQFVGRAFEVRASELHLKKNLYKTPYLKITNSGIGEITAFEKRVGKPEFYNIIKYCRANILNTVEPATILEDCMTEKKRAESAMVSMKGQEEIIVELLPKRVYFSKIKGLQFSPTEPTFEKYYQKQLKDFLNFIKIINEVGIGFVIVLFLVWLKFGNISWRPVR